MENLKNIAPVEGFDWEAYEKGDVLTNVSHEELEKAYDSTLGKVALSFFSISFKSCSYSASAFASALLSIVEVAE